MKKKLLLSPLAIVILIIVFGAGIAGAAIYLGGAGGTGEVNLQKGLVGWWKMDGNTKDSTPYGNNGTPNPCPAGHANNGNGTCTATFYPSQDGFVGQNPGDASFATVHDAASGNDIGTVPDNIPVLNEKAAGIYYINRGFLYFDTSSLTSGATISSATLSLYGNGSFSNTDGTAANQLVEGTQGTTLALADYSKYNTTILTTSNPSWAYHLSSSAYTDATLNASGIAVISKTGTTKFAVLTAGDLTNTAPTGNNTDRFYSSEKGGDFRPKLVVTYTPAAATGTFTTDRKGQANKAYSFNGTTDFITIPDSNNWNFGSGDFTIGAWINFTSVAGAGLNLVAQYGDSGSNGAFAFEFDTSTLRFFWSTTGSSELHVDGSWSPSTGTWYYVTAVRSGTSIKTYVNNAVIGSGTLSGTIYNSTRNLDIGAYRDGGQLFNGKMSDVRIYNRALSAAEIKASYEAYSSSVQISNLQKGLVAHWDFNGNAKDSTPNSNNGTVTGATLTTDRKGQSNKAYSFDNTTNRIVVDNSNSLNITGDITLAGWIKFNDLTGTRFLLSKWQESAAYMLYVPDSHPHFALMSATDVATDVVGAYTFVTGTWYHWVAVRSGSNMYQYINGVQDANTGSITGATKSSTYPVRLGNYYPDGSSPLNGYLDDVRIYNRALSATEVTALYQSYDPGIAVSTLQKGLVGNWKFDGNAKDATPYGNDGTLTGTTLTTDRKGQSNKAYSFNGTSDLITIANESNFDTILNGQSPVSFSAWLKPAALTGLGIIFNKGIDPTGSWCYQTTAALACEFKNGDNTNKISVSVSSFFTAGTWTHLVFTYSGSGQAAGIKIYKDGVSQSFTTAADGLSGTVLSDYPLKFASQNSNYYFSGSMDDARIYNRALTQTEVTALYQSY